MSMSPQTNPLILAFEGAERDGIGTWSYTVSDGNRVIAQDSGEQQLDSGQGHYNMLVKALRGGLEATPTDRPIDIHPNNRNIKNTLRPGGFLEGWRTKVWSKDIADKNTWQAISGLMDAREILVDGKAIVQPNSGPNQAANPTQPTAPSDSTVAAKQEALFVGLQQQAEQGGIPDTATAGLASDATNEQQEEMTMRGDNQADDLPVGSGNLGNDLVALQDAPPTQVTDRYTLASLQGNLLSAVDNIAPGATAVPTAQQTSDTPDPTVSVRKNAGRDMEQIRQDLRRGASTLVLAELNLTGAPGGTPLTQDQRAIAQSVRQSISAQTARSLPGQMSVTSLTAETRADILAGLTIAALADQASAQQGKEPRQPDAQTNATPTQQRPQLGDRPIGEVKGLVRQRVQEQLPGVKPDILSLLDQTVTQSIMEAVASQQRVGRSPAPAVRQWVEQQAAQSNWDSRTVNELHGTVKEHLKDIVQAYQQAQQEKTAAQTQHVTDARSNGARQQGPPRVTGDQLAQEMREVRRQAFELIVQALGIASDSSQATKLLAVVNRGNFASGTSSEQEAQNKLARFFREQLPSLNPTMPEEYYKPETTSEQKAKLQTQLDTKRNELETVRGQSPAELRDRLISPAAQESPLVRDSLNDAVNGWVRDAVNKPFEKAMPGQGQQFDLTPVESTRIRDEWLQRTMTDQPRTWDTQSVTAKLSALAKVLQEAATAKKAVAQQAFTSINKEWGGFDDPKVAQAISAHVARAYQPNMDPAQVRGAALTSFFHDRTPKDPSLTPAQLNAELVRQFPEAEFPVELRVAREAGVNQLAKELVLAQFHNLPEAQREQLGAWLDRAAREQPKKWMSRSPNDVVADLRTRSPQQSPTQTREPAMAGRGDSTR